MLKHPLTKFTTFLFAPKVRMTRFFLLSEYHDIMGKASQLLGKEMMGELFGIIGDSKTMKCS
jgi:hypothetical protein